MGVCMHMYMYVYSSLYFMSMCDFACIMSVYHVCDWCLQGPEEIIRSSGTRVTEDSWNVASPQVQLHFFLG